MQLGLTALVLIIHDMLLIHMRLNSGSVVRHGSRALLIRPTSKCSCLAWLVQHSPTQLPDYCLLLVLHLYCVPLTDVLRCILKIVGVIKFTVLEERYDCIIAAPL